MTTKDFFNLDNKNDKIFLGAYLVWIIIQILLFSTGSAFDFDNDFFPFDHGDLDFDVDVYDYTEFLFYSLLPLIALFIYRLIKSEKR